MIYRSSVGAARRLALASGVRHRSLLAAIDQGTSSSRVILYDESLRPIASHQQELQSATANPHPGWSEMDPMALLASVEASAAGALEKASATAADIAGVGITCQRESTVVWDRRTVHAAIRAERTRARALLTLAALARRASRSTRSFSGTTRAPRRRAPTCAPRSAARTPCAPRAVYPSRHTSRR